MALELCKYYKKQRYVSYNDGLTWQPLEEYEKGELYESHSSSCGAGVFQYRWVLINNGYICDGKDRYTREVYQYSEDGTVWYNVFPTQYRKGALVETDSPFCDNAGNGQYITGNTDPTSGDTPSSGYTCSDQNSHFDFDLAKCVCNDGFNYTPCSLCAKSREDCYKKGGSDPLKIVKCDNLTDGILTNSDVNYHTSGWVLTSYEIGECVEEIGSEAFNGQQYLTSVTIPTSVEKVNNLAFANCKKLETLNFPSSLTALGDAVFVGCENLKYVTFGGSIPNTIGNLMFKGCSSLENVLWLQNNNITTIGHQAFYRCIVLDNVVLPETLTSIGNLAFYECKSLSNITIPINVTLIGIGAFANNSALTYVNITSRDITIGDRAFDGCASLTAATFTSSAITMGNDVFNGCTGLLKLTFTSPTPFEIEDGYFDDTNDCPIFVPCESEQAYKTAWSQYADRISCNDTGIYYRWIDTDETQCDGYDEYIVQKQQITTNGITWSDTGINRIGELITHYSLECGYQGDVALTVTNIDGYTRYYEPCE